VMLEKQQGTIRRRLGKSSFEEAQPPVAQEAGMGLGALVERVERDDGCTLEHAHRLDEPVPVIVGICKGLSKWRAAVMVAEHEHHRHGYRFERVRKIAVRFALTRMCEISGDD